MGAMDLSESTPLSISASTSFSGESWQRQFAALGEALEDGNLYAAREIFESLQLHPQGITPSLFKSLGVFKSGKVTPISSRTLTGRC